MNEALQPNLNFKVLLLGRSLNGNTTRNIVFVGSRAVYITEGSSGLPGFIRAHSAD